MARPPRTPRPAAASRCYDRIACGLYFGAEDERTLIALQDRFPPSPCRHTRPHVTLRGGSQAGRLADALAALEDLARRVPPFEVQLTRVIVGEDPALGMTVVVEVLPSKEVMALEQQVRGVLDELAPLVGEPRNFVPHVTVYRREVTPLNARARALAHSFSVQRTLRVDHLSVAGEAGATWHPIRHFTLGGSRR